MTVPKRYQKHFVVDPVSKVRLFAGFLGERVGALVESVITHDPGLVRSRALGENFIVELRHRLDGEINVSEQTVGAQIAKAALASTHLDPTFEKEKNGYMTFTVLRECEQLDELWLFNLGPNLVLRITPLGLSQVMKTHSAVQSAMEQGITKHNAWSLAGTATAAVVPGIEFESKITFAKVHLQPGEWLLITPESKGLLNVHTPGKPLTLDAVCDIVDQLAAPYAQYTRTWLAFGRLA